MRKQGWFTTPGRLGDRTVEQQMQGLEKLAGEVSGKLVLDVGCAEGLIGVKLAQAGAKHVLGVEMVPGHVEVARKGAVEGVTDYVVADANTFSPQPGAFDVVLLLAILHKLKDPIGATKRLAAGAKSLVVVRLPAGGAVIKDNRSGNKPHDVGAALQSVGFDLESESRGPFNQWIGFYRRRAEKKESERIERLKRFDPWDPPPAVMKPKEVVAAAVEPPPAPPVESPAKPPAEPPPAEPPAEQTEEANVRPAEAEPEPVGGAELFPKPEQARVRDEPVRHEPEASANPEAPRTRTRRQRTTRDE